MTLTPMKSVKMWIGNLDGDRHGLVIAPSKARAIEILLHVELAPDGSVVPYDGPSRAQCSKHIVDAVFIGRVWLFVGEGYAEHYRGVWRSYDVAEFHRLSLLANGAQP